MEVPVLVGVMEPVGLWLLVMLAVAVAVAVWLAVAPSVSVEVELAVTVPVPVIGVKPSGSTDVVQYRKLQKGDGSR